MKNAHFNASTDTAQSRSKNLKALGLAGAAGTASLVAAQPASAQSQTTTDINTMVTDVGGIVGGAVTVSISVLVAYFGFKVVKRVMQ